MTLGAVALVAVGAAAVFINIFERQIAAMRTAERAFDAQARSAADGLADLRVAQSAYVAAGQGVATWMPKVSAATDGLSHAIAVLRSTATSEATRSTLDEATTALAGFTAVDRRARDYLRSSLPLMAGDVIFAEGGEAASRTAARLAAARSAERDGVDSAEANRRRQEATALLSAGAIAIAVMLGLALVAPAQAAGRAQSAVEAPLGDDLMLHHVPAPAPRYVTARPAGPVLRAAAQLCTDLGRVSDLEELRTLVARAADVMDASGLVIWVANPEGSQLQPALGHGYPQEVLERLPTLEKSADNAAAAAFRTSQLQIVLARPGSSSGAVVAPLLASQRCLGVLSAEVRDGGEASDSVQALAAIFAAQLATVLPTTPAAHEQRATGTL